MLHLFWLIIGYWFFSMSLWRFGICCLLWDRIIKSVFSPQWLFFCFSKVRDTNCANQTLCKRIQIVIDTLSLAFKSFKQRKHSYFDGLSVYSEYEGLEDSKLLLWLSFLWTFMLFLLLFEFTNIAILFLDFSSRQLILCW